MGFAGAQIIQMCLGILGIYWFFLGAYWRFNPWGELCSETYLFGPGMAIMAIYGIGVGFSCACCCGYSCLSMAYV